MKRRSVIKSILPSAAFLSGCTGTSPGSDTQTPTETSTPSFPPVGEFSLERTDRTPDVLWDLVLTVREDLSEGTLKIFEVPRNDAYQNELIDRIYLGSAGTKLRFPFISRQLHVEFPANEYIFRVEVGDEIIAKSTYKMNRSLVADTPTFESHIGGDDSLAEYEQQILNSGNTSFSIRVQNTGSVPLVIGTVAARDMQHYVSAGYWLNGKVPYAAGYIPDVLAPDESKRYGTVGYTLPRLGQVEDMCDGSVRTTAIDIETKSDRRWRYILEYSLSEPAEGTGLEALSSIDEEKFVCLGGELGEFTFVSKNE